MTNDRILLGPAFVTSQRELAKRLGIDRGTVVSWLKKPGCPGSTEKGFNVLHWFTFKLRRQGLDVL